MKRAISSWLHKFVDTAEKAVANKFKHQGLKTDEDQAKFKLLGDKVIASKNRPFSLRQP
jgi:hypothetical protein